MFKGEVFAERPSPLSSDGTKKARFTAVILKNTLLLVLCNEATNACQEKFNWKFLLCERLIQ